MAQIPVETQKANELAFGRFLSPHLVFAHERLFALHAPPAAADDAALTADVLAGQTKPRGLERVAIALMQFIGNVVSCSYYRPDLMSQIIGQSNGSSVRTISGKGDVNVTAEAVTETAAKISTHLTDKHVCDLCDFVVSTLLPLHGADLEQWNADPEGYLLAMEATTADESARAAAESLFLALLEVKSRAPRALARALPVAGASPRDLLRRHARPAARYVRFRASPARAWRARAGGSRVSRPARAGWPRALSSWAAGSHTGRERRARPARTARPPAAAAWRRRPRGGGR